MNRIFKGRMPRRIAASVLLGGALVGGLQMAAIAAPAPHQAAATAAKHATYNDEQMTEFLLFATGPVAVAKPDVAAKLKSMGAMQRPSNLDLSGLTGQLMSIDTNYHQTVTLGAQSGDPYKVKASLVQVSRDFVTLANRIDPTFNSRMGVDPDSQSGKIGARVKVAAYAVVLANAVVYANVAVATNAAAVLVLLALNNPTYVDSSAGTTDGPQQEAAAAISGI